VGLKQRQGNPDEPIREEVRLYDKAKKKGGGVIQQNCSGGTSGLTPFLRGRAGELRDLSDNRIYHEESLELLIW